MKNFDQFLGPVEIPFRIFKVAGLYWTKSSRLMYKAYGILSLLLLTQVMMSLQICCIVFEVKNIFEFSDVFSSFCTLFTTSIKSYHFLIFHSMILSLIDDLKDILELLSNENPQFGVRMDQKTKRC